MNNIYFPEMQHKIISRSQNSTIVESIEYDPNYDENTLILDIPSSEIERVMEFEKKIYNDYHIKNYPNRDVLFHAYYFNIKSFDRQNIPYLKDFCEVANKAEYDQFVKNLSDNQ